MERLRFGQRGRTHEGVGLGEADAGRSQSPMEPQSRTYVRVFVLHWPHRQQVPFFCRLASLAFDRFWCSADWRCRISYLPRSCPGVASGARRRIHLRSPQPMLACDSEAQCSRPRVRRGAQSRRWGRSSGNKASGNAIAEAASEMTMSSGRVRDGLEGTFACAWLTCVHEGAVDVEAGTRALSSLKKNQQSKGWPRRIS